ncbi:MAG: YfhO family protein, partial [Candidatus Korobacteraceae bacterium]
LSCPAHCFLVLGDLYLPGWQATIDGTPTPIYRSDAVVRGVFLSGGSHRVEFRYRPRSILIGLYSALLAGILVLGMTLYSVRQHPGQP